MSLFPYSGNFHFAFPATKVYRQLPLLRSFSAFVPEPKNRTCPAEPLPEPNGHDLPHFEAISPTPLPQPPPSSRLVSPACQSGVNHFMIDARKTELLLYCLNDKSVRSARCCIS